MSGRPATPERRDLRRVALALVAATAVVYLAETVAGVALGVAARSPALTGLGLDSAVKLVGAVILAWELGGRRDVAQERLALRLLALLFFAVAATLAVRGVWGLLDSGAPDVPPAGLVAAGLGALLLPPLVVAKRVLASALSSATLGSDADKTRLYALQCVAVLVGLTLT